MKPVRKLNEFEQIVAELAQFLPENVTVQIGDAFVRVLPRLDLSPLNILAVNEGEKCIEIKRSGKTYYVICDNVIIDEDVPDTEAKYAFRIGHVKYTLYDHGISFVEIVPVNVAKGGGV